MHFEFERRFLVRSLGQVPEFSRLQGYELIVQGYLLAADGEAVRVRRRLVMEGFPGVLSHKAEPVLEYKGAQTGFGRPEHQVTIDDLMAGHLIRLAKGVVQKRRYSHVARGLLVELDEFLFANNGLIIAELETEGPLPTDWQPPTWLGPEITNDPRWANEQLALRPISTWPEVERRRFGFA